MSLNILITGGTGSLGHELVTQLLSRGGFDDRIIVYSRDEQKQEAMAAQFNHDKRLRFFLGDVRDKDRLKLAVRGVDTIIHAAALQIVPALEYNPMEALKTNILGTQNLLEAVYETNYPYPTRVIALSTDKAVSPTNLYGASKLCLEKLVIAANNVDFGHHSFSVVRYGNVALSRGSVIPKFVDSVAQGDMIKVTDQRMTRFWITLKDAARFVLDRLEDMQGGEIFIPKMPSFRVQDIAHLMKSPFTYTGIRPGEKIHETIISEDEYANAEQRDKYYCIVSGVNSNLTGALTSANFVMDLGSLTEKLREVGVVG